MSKKKENIHYYVADFETSWERDYTKTWVWAACLMDIYSLKYKLDNSISDFIDTLRNTGSKGERIVVYFHNFKFDGSFIMDYMLREAGATQNATAKKKPRIKLKEGEYSELIDGFGKWYSVKMGLNGRQIEFRDSLKLLPMSIFEVGKSMKMEEQKGEIDYSLYREEGWDITEDEEDYIRRDCKIAATAIKELFLDKGYDGLTIGSNCLKEYKKLYPAMTKRFPELTEEEDKFVRKSYRGGICWVGDKEKYEGKITVIDKNSMYPSVMHSVAHNLYPCGFGKKIEGDPREHEVGNYNVWVTHITAIVEVKENAIPFLSMETGLKQHMFVERGAVDVILTKPDFELLEEIYDLYDLEFHEGYIYKGYDGVFDKYIDKWYKVKEEATKTKNYGLRLLAKLFLNNLYGKFATNPDSKESSLKINNKGVLGSDVTTSTKKSVYIPAGSFITAYARQDLIRTAMKCGGREKVLYMDTDSIHMIGDCPGDVPCHSSALNYWDIESVCDMGIYIRQKTYAERCEGEWNVKACGCPKTAKKNIKNVEDDFKIGLCVNGKLMPKKIPGGIVLVDSTFKIKG